MTAPVPKISCRSGELLPPGWLPPGSVPRLDRRRFLGGGLAVAASLALPRSVRAASPPDIAMVTGDPGPAVRAAVELLGGIGAFVKRGARVVIKPCISFDGDADGPANTHPLVTRELVALCFEAGADRVRVLDNPPHQHKISMKPTREALASFQKDLVFAPRRRELYREVSIPDPLALPSTEVMGDVLEADVLISVPATKTHNMTGVTLGLKGIMGLVWDRMCMHTRYDLNESIVDLASVIRPQLTVVDASRVLTTNGPSGPGRVNQANMVIASRDPVAADAATVREFRWYGRQMSPKQVMHLRLAEQKGLGSATLEPLQVARREL